MSEEQGGNSIKNILIGLASTVTIAVGGFVTNKLTGEDKEEVKQEVAAPAPAPVINITNTNQQKQEQAAPGKTVIIKEKAVPAAQPAPEKKKESEEDPW
jgi:nitrogenase subunit NifH